MVDEGAAGIAKPDWQFLILKQRGRRTGYGRGDIRPEGQRISVFIEKFIQLVGRNGSNLFAEHIKIFKRRRLDIMIPI